MVISRATSPQNRTGDGCHEQTPGRLKQLAIAITFNMGDNRPERVKCSASDKCRGRQALQSSTGGCEGR